MNIGKPINLFYTRSYCMSDTKIMSLLIHALVLFTAVPVHECAHAWAADKLGDSTPRNQGRVTLNPFAHLTLWGSLMLILAGFGWGKPVMIDPRNFKDPKKGMMLSSLAGPAANFVMAFIAMIIMRILINIAVIAQSSAASLLSYIFEYIAIINIGLGVFNFLPVPPLDGSKIFGAILPERLYFKIMQYERYIAIIMIVLLYSGLLDTPISFLQEKVASVLIFLTNWVDVIMGLFL